MNSEILVLIRKKIKLLEMENKNVRSASNELTDTKINSKGKISYEKVQVTTTMFWDNFSKF